MNRLFAGRVGAALAACGLLLTAFALRPDRPLADPSSTPLLLAATPPVAVTAPPQATATSSPQVAVSPQQVALTDAEATHLRWLREEEKLAHDLYVAFEAQWNEPLFGQIAQAEQRHMDAVAVLLTRYGVEDPAAGQAAGAFREPRLQTLYADLLTAGRASKAAAFRTAARVEDRDLADLDEALAATDRVDLERVFGNLARGSRNHLRLFSDGLTALGETYTPEHLAADRYAAIVAGPLERGGPGAGQQAGNGLGAGRGRAAGPGAGQGRGLGAGRGMGANAGRQPGRAGGRGACCATPTNPGGARPGRGLCYTDSTRCLPSCPMRSGS